MVTYETGIQTIRSQLTYFLIPKRVLQETSKMADHAFFFFLAEIKSSYEYIHKYSQRNKTTHIS